MSYPKEDRDIVDRISYKKEFALYADIQDDKKPTEIDVLKQKESILELNAYQSFIKNYFNPNTKYNKLYLVHGTGTGKTITSLSAINEYIKVAKDSPSSKINNVIIIGFTKNIFKKELLTFPNFNFLSKEEIDELLYVESQAKYNEPNTLKYLNELKIKYSRRLFNRSLGGIFKFYGYKELLMKILDFSKVIRNGIKLSNIKSSDIHNYLETGEITINESIMKIFANSLIVCDEIHNVYNSFHINNWGTVLELIIDYYNDPSKKGKDMNYNSVRIMYLSATPISNNPIELISIINLLNNKEDRVTTDMIFDSNGEIQKKKIPKIRSLLYGKISYVMDNNPAEYPSSSFVGESISHIRYLKFIRCPMSSFHKQTYIHLSQEQSKDKELFSFQPLKDTSSEFSDSVLITREMRLYPVNLALHNRYLNDYVLPNPDDEKNGIFLGSDLDKIHHADKKWKDKHGVYTEIDMYNQYIFSGPFLSESSLKKYSSKYHTMLRILKDIILHKNGKIFIYHHFVNNSGVMFIQSVLQENGFILNDHDPIGSTLCIHCCRSLQKHNKKTNTHDFTPIRFTVITGNIPKTQVYKNLDAFNQSSNTQGEEIKIVIGSKAIKESYNLKGIQHILITHSPDNISDLIQVIGRAIRKYSHMELPAPQRHTNIYILVSSLEEKVKPKYLYTFEEARYKSKVNIYKTIQSIENIIYEVSIDYLINFMINKREIPRLIGSSFYMNTNAYSQYTKKIYKQSLDMSTFNAYYIEDEINIIKYIIKRLFIECQPAFSYSDLFAYVRNPPFLMNINTALFSESSFILAIESLLYRKDNVLKVIQNKKELQSLKMTTIQSLYDPNAAVIMGMDGLQYIIMDHKDIFVMVQYYLYVDELMNESIKIDHIMDSVYRKSNLMHIKNIPITEYVQQEKIVYQFDTLLDDILHVVKETVDTPMKIIQQYPFEFHVFLVEKMISEYLRYILQNEPIQNDLFDLYLFLLPSYLELRLIITVDMIEINTIYLMYQSIIDSKNHKDTLQRSDVRQFNRDKKIPKKYAIVGHYLHNTPTLYSISNNTWIEYPSILKKVNYIDNKKIIGFDVKQKGSIRIDFKIKVIIDKSSKAGEGSKGVICSFYSKEIIYDICKMLEIPITAYQSSKGEKKETLCSLIRSKLLELDAIERKKQSNLKYFYYFYEHVY